MTDNEENMWMHQKKGCEGGKKDKIIPKYYNIYVSPLNNFCAVRFWDVRLVLVHQLL